MRNVPGDPTSRQLTHPLKCEMFDGTTVDIPIGFIWDGSSTPTTPLAQFLIPRFGHPVDSCKHDWRCRHAKSKEERKWNDKQYRLGIHDTPITATGFKGWHQKKWLGVQSIAGYLGVRIGALFGVGNNF